MQERERLIGVRPLSERALATSSSRSARAASLAACMRLRAALCAAPVMRSRIAAVRSGSVAFGSPRMPTLAG